MFVRRYRLSILIIAVFLLFASSLVVSDNLEDAKATSAKKEMEEMGNKAERTAKKGAETLEEISNKIKSGFNSNNSVDINSNNINENDKGSIAAQIREIAMLKEEGILTEEEFTEMKNDLFKNKNNANNDISITDELRELAKVKEEGIITQKEFNKMKKDLIE